MTRAPQVGDHVNYTARNHRSIFSAVVKRCEPTYMVVVGGQGTATIGYEQVRKVYNPGSKGGQ